MEFKDMQVIWNSETQEKLFAINETAMYEAIKHKSQSIDQSLQKSEWIAVGVNLLVGLMLTIDGLRDGDHTYQYVLPLMYLGFFIVGLLRRKTRQQKQMQFDKTMVGEVDKAIWQVDYLIKQARSMMVWYLLPLTVVTVILMVLNSQVLWAIGMLTVLVPVVYFGLRWEVNRCYTPKKAALESLRETITTKL